ncbi:hypothetical protein GW17_00019416 [Ensete ventricosum]|nr:hypothetical protein GW17_00019416 [Ensete ventricosum]
MDTARTGRRRGQFVTEKERGEDGGEEKVVTGNGDSRCERKPELTTEVMAFRDYLLSSTVSDTLEVWELKGIDEL